jgi:hypothetical protein
MNIPDDIMQAAREAAIQVLDRSTHCDCDECVTMASAPIAKAILSERNRCAVIARNWQPSSFQDEQYAANSIADKIMAGER